ncbi:MAG: right-handed parallel beta-helix repeat-containing protein [Bacteroidota bacterium]|nr:right-handed parallel beta-helix repeat-containing protein [Bacteroidota bacterium]
MNFKKLTGILLFSFLLFGLLSCSNENDSMFSSYKSGSYYKSSLTPTLTTTQITSVTSTGATSGGTISSKGGSYTITSSGVCWSTTSNPTIANHVVTTGNTSLTTFSCAITGLSSSTVYYVRAYATNSGGYTGYGNQVSFTAGTAVTSPSNVAGYTPSSPISLSGQSNKTIQGLYIGNIPGVGINLANCHDMTITGCKISRTGKNGIHLTNCYNITITHCEIDSVMSGLYAENCTGGIQFNYNDVKNILGPMPQAQMVQFNTCTGANNQVNYNTCDNVPGKSSPEDLINMFMSSGTSASPILITGNKLRGGGPSGSGGGIMLGDNGGSYQVASNNILVDPGQYGMSISGGSNNSITGNQIYARSQSFTNVGLYIWNQNTSACANNTLQNNRINFRDKSGNINDTWNGSSTSGSNPACTGTVWLNNADDQTLSASILPTVLFGTNR